MADWNEDDSSFTFTNGSGQQMTVPKNESTMAPGGVYVTAKNSFGGGTGAKEMGPPASAAMPAPNPIATPSLAGTFDPTAAIQQGSMNAAVGAGMTAPAPQGVNPGVSAIADSQNQAGAPAAPMPPSATPGMSPMYGTTTDVDVATKRLSGRGQDAAADMEESGNKYMQSVVDAGRAQNEVAKGRAEATAHELEVQNQQERERRLVEDQEVQRRLDDIKKVEAEYGAMDINNDRLFGSGVTGSKIMAVIGMSLGAIGGALAKTDFGVDKLIMKAIENDIDAQKAQMSKTGNVLQQKRGGLADYQNATRDQRSARDLEKARQLGIVSAKYDAIAAANGNAEVAAKANGIKAGLDAERAKLIASAESTVTTVSKKTAPIASQLEAATQADMDKARTNAQALASIDRVMELKKTIGTGPLEGRWQSIQGKLGIQAADYTEFQGRLNALLSDTVRSISGATASDQERDFIKTFTANQNMGDESFDRTLSTMRQRLDGEQKVLEKSALDQRRRPLDTQSYYNEYRKAYGGGGGTKFTPAGK